MPNPSSPPNSEAQGVFHSLRKARWRFDGELEAQFQTYYDHALIARARWSGLAAIGVMLVYAVLDVFMIPREILPQFLYARGLLVILPLGLYVAATYRSALWPRLQVMGGTVAISSGLGIVAIVCIARLNGTPIEYEGLLLAICYFYCCGGLRLKTAFIAGMAISVVYPLAESWAGLSRHDVVVRTLFLASTNVLGLISAGIAEHAARQNFQMRQQLRDLASRDFLTGLLNRRALDERLEGLWRHAAREGLPLSIAIADVDHFKKYNDHYGHAQGDHVLQQVAQVLQKHARRPLDIASRYGGEEFVCVWPYNNVQDLEALLQCLQADVAALNIAHAHSEPTGRVSLSMGVVHLPSAHAHSMNEALHAADMALYAAKEQGRNRYVLRQLP